MSTLLLKVQGLRPYNLSFFAPQLYVYDDFLMYKRRSWLIVREMTISYNQIAQVNLHKILYVAHLEIRSTGTDDIMVKFIYTPEAVKAKKIIDQKIRYAHAKYQSHDDGVEYGNRWGTKPGTRVQSFEKSVKRLQELVQRGQLSEKEYASRKKQLLKKTV